MTKKILKTTNSLQGFCLICMPHIINNYFSRSVILICSHDNKGAMGFMLTQKVIKPTFADIYTDLNLTLEAKKLKKTGYKTDVYCGGPIEKGRGFVLHTPDIHFSDTINITKRTSFTSTIDALKYLASDTPPAKATIMLGYAGWVKGQLEKEISNNQWLICPPYHELIFAKQSKQKYEFALSLMGIEEAALSRHFGSA